MTHSPLISLFKEQLENESLAIASRVGLTKRGYYLIWWYFSKLTGLSESEIESVVCDGTGDLGIDGIMIDQENYVHFYQFKNPVSVDKVMEAGEIDKMLSGLNLILSRNHKEIANEELIGRIEEIYQSVPAGYRIHIVTSGAGIPDESVVKLDSFIKNLHGPSDEFISWGEENIKYLQDYFYRKTLPTIDETISFEIERIDPYQVRTADHDCYMFHSTGKKIGELYESFGEQLLQQNIRVYQGDKSTNVSIRDTCVGDDAANFFHFNNGITFLCEEAGWDRFTGKVTIKKAQIVNGGQTARVLHQAYKEDSLRGGVLVPIRVITSQGDKEFASNVAVNLNNQNKVESSFLRSNHPHIIQLANSLATLGWYLERREGEVKSLTSKERQAIEHKLGNKIEQNCIKLKEGAQAFAATFYRQPELAKKNPKLLFLSRSDGGHFERMFNSDLTAENFLYSSEFKGVVDDYVKDFGSLKRRKSRSDNWEADYLEFFPKDFFDKYKSILDQVIPQCSVFVTATIFEKYIRINKQDILTFLNVFREKNKQIIINVLDIILKFANDNPALANKSWPTLLKSQSFFTHICSYIKGQEEIKAERIRIDRVSEANHDLIR